jgi:hypothetical protein
MIEILLPYGFDTLEYSWVKAIIGIYMLADYSVAKKHQQCAYDAFNNITLLVHNINVVHENQCLYIWKLP